MEKIQRIEACVFQRDEGGDWEKGILLNEGRLGIIDARGKKIKDAWCWEIRTSFAIETTYFE